MRSLPNRLYLGLQLLFWLSITLLIIHFYDNCDNVHQQSKTQRYFTDFDIKKRKATNSYIGKTGTTVVTYCSLD